MKCQELGSSIIPFTCTVISSLSRELVKISLLNRWQCRLRWIWCEELIEFEREVERLKEIIQLKIQSRFLRRDTLDLDFVLIIQVFGCFIVTLSGILQSEWDLFCRSASLIRCFQHQRISQNVETFCQKIIWNYIHTELLNYEKIKNSSFYSARISITSTYMKQENWWSSKALCGWQMLAGIVCLASAVARLTLNINKSRFRHYFSNSKEFQFSILSVTFVARCSFSISPSSHLNCLCELTLFIIVLLIPTTCSIHWYQP